MDNYPPGAANDPRAPWNNEESWCEKCYKNTFLYRGEWVHCDTGLPECSPEDDEL